MRRARVILILSCLLLPLLPAAARAQKIVKETITSGGKQRTYYLFVPEAAKGPGKVPLLITLHGSGRDGKSLVSKWDGFAKKEGFIVVGPEAIDPEQWQPPEDGPDMLRELVDALSARFPVDPRRVYLFGHSGGALFALVLSMLESEYFAATAIHAGAWRPEHFAVTRHARRKIPIFIVSGTKDAFFPIAKVRETRDRLAAKGFPIELKEMPGHDHEYYDVAYKINRDVWDFLSKHVLSEDPHYQQHRFAQ